MRKPLWFMCKEDILMSWRHGSVIKVKVNNQRKITYFKEDGCSQFYSMLPNCFTKWLHIFVFLQLLKLFYHLVTIVVQVNYCKYNEEAPVIIFVRYLPDYFWSWTSFQTFLAYFASLFLNCLYKIIYSLSIKFLLILMN